MTFFCPTELSGLLVLIRKQTSSQDMMFVTKIDICQRVCLSEYLTSKAAVAVLCMLILSFGWKGYGAVACEFTPLLVSLLNILWGSPRMLAVQT